MNTKPMRFRSVWLTLRYFCLKWSPDFCCKVAEDSSNNLVVIAAFQELFSRITSLFSFKMSFKMCFLLQRGRSQFSACSKPNSSNLNTKCWATIRKNLDGLWWIARVRISRGFWGLQDQTLLLKIFKYRELGLLCKSGCSWLCFFCGSLG